MIVLLGWTDTLISTFSVNTLGAWVTRVPPLDRLIIALVNVETLRTLSAIVKSASVPGFAATIVPTGHIEAGGGLVASVKIARTFVQVQFATIADVTASTRTSSWRHTLTTVLTGLIANS